MRAENPVIIGMPTLALRGVNSCCRKGVTAHGMVLPAACCQLRHGPYWPVDTALRKSRHQLCHGRR